MTDQTLYQLDTLALGASNLVYVSRADGSADGSASLTAVAAIIDGVNGALYQPVDADLTALAGLTSAADKLPYFTGASAAALATFTSFGRSLVDDADAAAARTTLGVAIGTDVQAQDAELSAIAGLTSANNKLPYFTGSGTATLADFTSFGRSLVDDADAATARTTLGLAIGTNVQAYSANLTTFAGIAPSANVQTLLGAADYSAFRTSLGLTYFATGTDAANLTGTISVNRFNSGTSASSSTFLRGDGTWAAASGSVSDGDKGDVVVSSSGATWTLDMPLTPGGRLTLTSNTPVMTTDATAQGTVYYAPYVHARCPIYDGTNWAMMAFSQLSLTLNSTDNLLENVYDVYVFNNSGTLTLGTGPAWINTATITVTIATPAVVTWTGHGLAEGAPVIFTNSGGALPTGITAGTTYYVTNSPSTNSFNISTSLANAAAGTKVATSGSQSGTHTGTNHTSIRGTGAGTTELELKDGIWTNKNAITLRAGGSSLGSISANRAAYLGTIYCTANGQTGMAFMPVAAGGGPAAVLGVWNAYNRVRTISESRDSTASWTYNSTTWRSMDNSTANRLTYVDGLGQSAVCGSRTQFGTSAAASSWAVGMSRDSTSAQPQNSSQAPSQGGATINSTVTIRDAWTPALGLRYVQAMEVAVTATNNTFYGADAGPPAQQRNAMVIELEI